MSSVNSIKPNIDGRGLRIGIVQSRFNEPVVVKMLAACVGALSKCGVADADIDHVSVPGALEIPVALRSMALQSTALQSMALTRHYDALIAIGAVIRGETYHFEIVSNESCRGVMDVMLETGVPISNGILTVNTDAEADARVVEKGADCALAAVEMAHALKAIAALHKDAI